MGIINKLARAAKTKEAVRSYQEDLFDYETNVLLIDRAIRNLSANDLYSIKVNIEYFNTDESTENSYLLFDCFTLDTMKEPFTEEERLNLGRVLAHFLSLRRKKIIKNHNRLKDERR